MILLEQGIILEGVFFGILFPFFFLLFQRCDEILKNFVRKFPNLINLIH